MVCSVLSGSLNDDSSIGSGSLYWMVDCGVDWGDYIVTSIAVPRLAEFVTRWTEVWIRQVLAVHIECWTVVWDLGEYIFTSITVTSL